MKGLLVIFSIVVLKGCWTSPDSQMMLVQENDNTNVEILNNTYQINTLGDEDASSLKLNITFNDSTKQVSGFSGCNRFFGSYSLEDNALSFEDLGLTRMLCHDEANTIEKKLINAIEKANLIVFKKDGFSLYDKNKLLITAKKEVRQSSVSFEYSSTSRGNYKLIKINNKSISSALLQGGIPLKKNIDKKQWDIISGTVSDMDFEYLPSLEAPSKQFLFDGAAMARLKITSNGTTYESKPFDHGNPPKEIASLIKEILYLAKNIE